MNGVLLALGIGVLLWIIAWMIGWAHWRAGGRADLGSVSHQWIAEHRMAHPQERQP
jgi:hypothetical protein